MNNVDKLLASLFEQMAVVQTHIDSKKTIIDGLVANGMSERDAFVDWYRVLVGHWKTVQHTSEEIHKARKQ